MALLPRYLFPSLPQLLVCCPLPAKHYSRKAWPIVKRTWQSNVHYSHRKPSVFAVRFRTYTKTASYSSFRLALCTLHYILRFSLFTFTFTAASDLYFRTTCTDALRVTRTKESLGFGHHRHYLYKLCSRTITLALQLAFPCSLQLHTPLPYSRSRITNSQQTP
jgi:hypothetical protein